MTQSEQYLFDSEDRICAAIDNLTGALAILEGAEDLEADKCGAAFRMVDTANDELKALKAEFETAFDATFKNKIYTDDQRETMLEGILDDLGDTASWRAEKAAEYPDDDRNAMAAATITELMLDKAASPESLDQLCAFWENPDCVQSEKQSEVMKSIGFHRFPKTINDLISEIVN